MNARLPVTVIVPTRNEEDNVGHGLVGAVGRVSRVIVVDSGSTDRTRELAEAAGAEVVSFRYGGGYPKKRQWALDNLNIDTPWVLLLDADEEVPEGLWVEVAAATRHDRAEGYFIKKEFHFLGRRLAFGGFSHSAILLFRRGAARFEQPGFEDTSGLDIEVHERILLGGRAGRLRTPLIHSDRKSLSAYVERHNRYSTWEAAMRREILSSQEGELRVKANLLGDVQERRRALKAIAMRMPFEPAAWFLYHFVGRLGFLEGRRGLIASEIRAHYIAQVRAKMYEMSLRGGAEGERFR
jgi:glycosyltransferase involved in cell wall biosynthesis